jgi:tetratricopeptide (TPR) repeat protein
MNSIQALLFKIFASVLLLCVCGIADASAQGRAIEARTSFVRPPRSIVDITELLDKETFDKAKRAELVAQANSEPTGGGKGAEFYYARARARAALGRTLEAIADCEKAIPLSGDYVAEGSRIEQFMEIQLRLNGDFKAAIAILEKTGRKLDIEGTTNRGRAPYIYGRLAYNYIQLGDLPRAESYLRRMESVLAQVRPNPGYQPYLTSYESNIEEIRAFLASSRGRWTDAEAAFRRAGSLYADAMQKSRSWPNASPVASFQYAVFSMGLGEARSKVRQGRLAEAEVDFRRLLLGRLKLVGTYHPDIAQVLYFLAEVMGEQGRHDDAEALVRKSIEIHRTIGYKEDGQQYVGALNTLARTLYAQGRFADAREAFATFDRATQSWSKDRVDRMQSGVARAFTYYYTDDIEKGIELARGVLAFEKRIKGEHHQDTAMARAVLAASSSRSRAPSGGSFGCRCRRAGGASGLAGRSRCTWPRNARCRSARDGSRVT